MNWFDRWIMRQPKRPPMTEHRPDPRVVPWKYNTFWPRVWASFVDMLVLMPLVGVSMTLIYRHSSLPPFLILLIYIANTLVNYLYRIILHGCFGQTVGKMVVKVKVLALDESPLGLKRALLRESINIAIAAMGLFANGPLILKTGSLMRLHEVPHGNWYFLLAFFSQGWFLIDLLTLFASARRRAAHDFIAGSVVVRLQTQEAAGRRPGLPTRAMSPVTVRVIIIAGLLAFTGLKLHGYRNMASLSFFQEIYSDRQLAQNLRDGDFAGPARLSLSILAGRKSPLGEAKARSLLSDGKDWLSGAQYLAALGHKDSIPYLIRALEEGDAKRLRVFDRRQIINQLKGMTGRDFGDDVKAWKDWWNEQYPSMKIESGPEKKESTPSTNPISWQSGLRPAIRKTSEWIRA